MDLTSSSHWAWVLTVNVLATQSGSETKAAPILEHPLQVCCCRTRRRNADTPISALPQKFFGDSLLFRIFLKNTNNAITRLKHSWSELALFHHYKKMRMQEFGNTHTHAHSSCTEGTNNFASSLPSNCTKAKILSGTHVENIIRRLQKDVKQGRLKYINHVVRTAPYRHPTSEVATLWRKQLWRATSNNGRRCFNPTQT